MNIDWHYEQKGQIDDEIFNKTGDEMLFEDEGWDSLAREIIQNSLDAKDKNSDGPVHVKFSYETCEKSEYKFLEVLQSIIELCLKEEQLNENIRRKFSAGLMQLKKNSVKIISITDSNTSGLIGCDDPKTGTNNFWYSLLYQRGKSDKGLKNSGGSQGVGKFAPFSFSLLNTVFYGTNTGNNDNEIALQGIGRLTSFKINNEYMRAKIIHSDSNSDGKFIPIYDNFNHFPDYFVPNQKGTTVNIIAARESSLPNIKKEFVHSVLKNFFVAVDRGYLTVDVMDTYHINSNTLEKYMNNMIDKSDMRYQMYYAYKYGKKYITKEWTMYYDLSENVKYKTINILKNKGMLIDDYNIKGLYSEIVGILIINDNNRCEQIKVLENAKHTKFITKKEESDTKKIKSAIKYIKTLKDEVKNKCLELTKPEIKDESNLDLYDDLLNIFTDDVKGSKKTTTLTFEDNGKQKRNTVLPPNRPNPSPLPPTTTLDEIQQLHIPRVVKNDKDAEIYFEFTSGKTVNCEIRIQATTDDNRISNELSIGYAVLNNKTVNFIGNRIPNQELISGKKNSLKITLTRIPNYRLDLKLYKKEGVSL